ncbi:hypothetical protein A0H81_12997 [Grifola frondosa]|uniref:Uncharacterized protein n=1 Tax=Grifola frondosa TaxID=5627 RepID=A0A1C7LQM6_GRIFR|nr:hypothetical protein A0H81_12997 [Grifola frondosa]
MADIPPYAERIPEVFQPLFDYLSSVLPQPIYSFTATLLSHSFTLLSSLFALIITLVSSSPSSWKAETILPPLITLLAAYLALVSFYRTAGWMIRTTFWFVKWGSILGALVAGTGWMLGNAHANGENGLGELFEGNGILYTLGSMLLGTLNGQGQNAAGGSRARRSSRSRPGSHSRAERPKAWESWDRHNEWQYKEGARGRGNEASLGAEVQKVVEKIFGAAGNAMKEGGWWESAKGAVEEFTRGLDGDNAEAQAKPDRKSQKGKTSSTVSLNVSQYIYIILHDFVAKDNCTCFPTRSKDPVDMMAQRCQTRCP